MMRRKCSWNSRRGAVAPLTALIIVVLLGMIAFGVDVGYILVVRSEAQNAADSAALAGVAKLAERLKAAPIADGVPKQTGADLALIRAEVKAFAKKNSVGAVWADVKESDIEIGYMADPYNHSSNTLDTTGWPARPYNAVRVRVARDSGHDGGALGLFFAPVLGTNQVDVSATATAAVAMGTITALGDTGSRHGGLLPFAYQIDEWNALVSASGPGVVVAANGKSVTFTDGYVVRPQSSNSEGVTSGTDNRMEARLYPDRATSGNYGTVNFSKAKVGNSTQVLSDLIENGPNLEAWPDIPEIVAANPQHPVDINGETGISAGMEDSVESIIGEAHIIPLFTTYQAQGNTTSFKIVGFAPITVVDARLNGGDKYILIQPRVIADESWVNGGDKIEFELTPSANPNPLYLGARGLVR